MPKKKTDLTGCVYGNLTVTSFHEVRGRTYYWYCLCSCGKEISVQSDYLKSNAKTSCGHDKESIITYDKAKRCYFNMIQRCYNEKNPRYKDYGGRGIKVCNRWLKSQQNFIDDMGICPDKYSIDRIDNEDDYTPENVKWSTSKEQSNNRRNSRSNVL